MNERVLDIGRQWEKMVQVKRRCHNVTDEDMRDLKILVDSFNSYLAEHTENYRPIVKISGCQIPQICGRVANFLKTQGLIDNVFHTKIKNNWVYEF